MVGGGQDAAHRSVRLLATVLTAALLAGCGVPLPPEVPDTSTPRTSAADAEVDRLVPPDEGTASLIAALLAIEERVAEARDLLAEGADEAEDRGAVLAVLLGERTTGGTGGDLAPGVLPAIAPDRAGGASDDLVTALITLAGDVGGERSRIVLELVRDPMLGDLGAWQRDPVGVIGGLRRIADAAVRSGDVATLDEDLRELPGQLTRALGYAFVFAADADPSLIAHASVQGVGRLGVVLVALELAIERLGATS